MKRMPVISMGVGRGICLALWLVAVSATAALPDPVALGVAVELGDIATVRRWLDEGLDPNVEADRIGTGLMIGAWEGNLPMMELFLARGADVQKANRFGEQALQLAAWRGHIEAVRWLLGHGATVNRDGAQWTALHYAVFAGHQEVAQLLIARGANVDARTPNGSTPLMMAAHEGQEELAKALIAAGADPGPANERGETALTWAMRYGNLRIARLVTSAEAFARAAQAAPESFGVGKKSVPAPTEISDLLERLRQAEARGESTEEVRLALAKAIARFKQDSTPISLKTKSKTKTKQRPVLVITAQRKGGGERAEVLDAAGGQAASTVGTPAQRPADYDDRNLAEFTDLLDRLNRAQQEGRPTAELRRMVRAAYERLKQQPRQ
jgi:hypothetical protein